MNDLHGGFYHSVIGRTHTLYQIRNVSKAGNLNNKQHFLKLDPSSSAVRVLPAYTHVVSFVLETSGLQEVHT